MGVKCPHSNFFFVLQLYCLVNTEQYFVNSLALQPS